MGRHFHKEYILDNLNFVNDVVIRRFSTQSNKEKYRLRFKDLEEWSSINKIESTLKKLNYTISSINIKPQSGSKQVVFEVFP
jgi:hypothetical protein